MAQQSSRLNLVSYQQFGGPSDIITILKTLYKKDESNDEHVCISCLHALMKYFSIQMVLQVC